MTDKGSSKRVLEDSDTLALESPRRSIESKREALTCSIKALQDKLAEVEQLDPDMGVVRVLNMGSGIMGSRKATAADFEKSFRRAPESFRPEGITLFRERNYAVWPDNTLAPPEDEYFIRFASVSDADRALSMKVLKLSVEGHGFGVSFVKPDAFETRKTFRDIGGLIDRIKAIDKELVKIGAVRDEQGIPRLSGRLVDVSTFQQDLTAWKRARLDGQSLGDQAYVALRSCESVDMAALEKRLVELKNEEADARIELCELKMAGYEFEYKQI